MEGYLNTSQAAKVAGISRWKILRLSKTGKFPRGWQLHGGGRGTYYREDEVRAWKLQEKHGRR